MSGWGQTLQEEIELGEERYKARLENTPSNGLQIAKGISIPEGLDFIAGKTYSLNSLQIRSCVGVCLQFILAPGPNMQIFPCLGGAIQLTSFLEIIISANVLGTSYAQVHEHFKT